MEWRDDGIVIGLRKHGETSVILEALTRAHGRHMGLVHGGRSRRMRPCLQPGNTLELCWRSRIEDFLGSFSVEPRVSRAARVIGSGVALHVVNHLCVLVRLLPEREPHGALHDRLTDILDAVEDTSKTPALVVGFELALLAELGFGLDLSACAATGRRDDLAYVSPKSGRAVSRSAGYPYRERLFQLPSFVRQGGSEAPRDDVADGFRLTEHFLLRDVFVPRGLTFSNSRAAYIEAVRTEP